MNKYEKTCGIFLPIFSLPNKYGIGTLGKEAKKFIDFLKECKQSYWQILPLGYTSFGDSPYQVLSTFAGGINYIDLESLVDDNLLSIDDLKDLENSDSKIDYENLYHNRYIVLKKAYENFLKKDQKDFFEFIKNNDYWLKDFSIFMFLKKIHQDTSFYNWPSKYKMMNQKDKEELYINNQKDIDFYAFIEYLFFKELKELKDYANLNNIKLIGDMPVYVALDSCDVWSHPELFLLGDDYIPEVVAGVPPDYFTKEGQLWGNPIYDYKYLEKTNYEWFIKRVKHHLDMYDIIRLDHFRGYASYYEVKFGAKNAIGGTWQKGPQMKLFKALKKSLNIKLEDRIIAEDLGFLTEDVYQLLKDTNLLGMKVLQFGMPDKNNPHMTVNYKYKQVSYIGTHDNDTTLGWFKNLTKEKQLEILNYLRCDRKDVVNKMIELIMKSRSKIVIISLMDYLNLDSDARINTPGKLQGNWTFRLPSNCINKKLIEYIKNITINTKRDMN